MSGNDRKCLETGKKNLECRKYLETGKRQNPLNVESVQKQEKLNPWTLSEERTYVTILGEGLKMRNISQTCLGQSLSDVTVHHHPSTNQYIGVQASQEKLPGNFNVETLLFRVGGRLMHFNLSVFSHASLFSTVLSK